MCSNRDSIMEKQLHKCLIGYFSNLDKLDNKWKELANNSERPLSSLRNQSEQLRLVSSDEVDNAELCNFEGFKESLIFKINVGIEDEIALLLEIILQLNNASQELKNKLSQLENARDKVDLQKPDMTELVQGTPHRPRLNLLMEWAIGGYEYYHELYTNINFCMKGLDCMNEETITNFTKSFVEDKYKRENMDRKENVFHRPSAKKKKKMED